MKRQTKGRNNGRKISAETSPESFIRAETMFFFVRDVFPRLFLWSFPCLGARVFSSHSISPFYIPMKSKKNNHDIPISFPSPHFHNTGIVPISSYMQTQAHHCQHHKSTRSRYQQSTNRSQKHLQGGRFNSSQRSQRIQAVGPVDVLATSFWIRHN